MRILAIETASEACSVALFEGDCCLAHDHRILGRGHAEELVPMIGAMPQKGRADRILVSLGPGSFTGVRIGLATARALGVAWNAEVLGYPTLSLLHKQAQRTSSEKPIPTTICINGGHGEWFVQNFSAKGEIESDLLSLKPEHIAQFPIHDIIVGNRAKECADITADDHIAIDLLPNAQFTHLLSSQNLTQDLRPIYGRAPDATPQKPAIHL